MSNGSSLEVHRAGLDNAYKIFNVFVDKTMRLRSRPSRQTSAVGVTSFQPSVSCSGGAGPQVHLDIDLSTIDVTWMLSINPYVVEFEIATRPKIDLDLGFTGKATCAIEETLGAVVVPGTTLVAELALKGSLEVSSKLNGHFELAPSVVYGFLRSQKSGNYDLHVFNPGKPSADLVGQAGGFELFAGLDVKLMSAGAIGVSGSLGPLVDGKLEASSEGLCHSGDAALRAQFEAKADLWFKDWSFALASATYLKTPIWGPTCLGDSSNPESPPSDPSDLHRVSLRNLTHATSERFDLGIAVFGYSNSIPPIGVRWTDVTTGESGVALASGLVYPLELDGHLVYVRLDSTSAPRICIGGGTHRWKLVGYTVGDGTESAEETVSVDCGVVNRLPVGSLESISAGAGTIEVKGWTADPDTPATPLSVRVTIDDDPTTPSSVWDVIDVVASQPRPDVTALDTVFGANHGFASTIPVSPAGRYRVCVEVPNMPTAHGPLLGCHDVDVSAPPNASPVITDVSGAQGIVDAADPQLTIAYEDADCNVVAILWKATNLDGETTSTAQVNGACSHGIGFTRFDRTCHWSGTWSEQVTLIDARGNRSPSVAYSYRCDSPIRVPAPSLAACAAGASHSTNSATPARLRIVNEAGQPVVVFWMNFDGVATYWTTLGTGREVTLGTWITHPWAVTDASGRCLAATTTSQVTQDLIVLP
jgi:hypothetical protein